ncbi:MAG: hypothetical protein A2939_03930 [Parcubacteria group bacterium RIFCSPLOWO2_01_FULL_48_18]|nr:MAG: hypothetical protein A2939_03930 [Parcubacteria group bacterium RIFCSPLOWO2_01_FULL_48_18]
MIAALTLFLLMVKPLYGDMLMLRGKFGLKISERNDKQNVLKQIRDLLNKYEGFTPLQEKIALALPLEADVPTVAALLSVVSERNNVALESISFEPPTVGQPPKPDITYGYAAMRVSLELAGLYENLRALIEDIASNIRLMDVHDVKIEGGSDNARGRTNNQTILRANIELDVYYQAKELPATRTRASKQIQANRPAVEFQ